MGEDFVDAMLRAAATHIYGEMTDEQWSVYSPFWHENHKGEALAVARMTLERAARACQKQPSEIRLAVGEMTAQEMRTAKTVLAWMEADILALIASSR